MARRAFPTKVGTDGTLLSSSQDIAGGVELQHVMRGVSSTRVLEAFGSIFAEHVEDTKVFATARSAELESESFVVWPHGTFPTTFIDRFVSHSWRGSRFAKWANLAHLHHFRVATLSTAVYWLVVTAGGMWWRSRSGEALMSFRTSFCVYSIAPLLIMCTIVAFAQSFGMGCVATTCFVDKLCIHQTDARLKLAGMRSLGQFLDISERMTVLWSEDYFQRLWCIFEVATFGSRKGAAAMEVLPLWIAPFLYGMLITNSLVMVFASWLQSSTLFLDLLDVFGASLGIGLFSVICNFLPGVLTCMILRYKVIKHREAEAWVLEFNLDECKVAVESDRLLIYSEIAKLFGSEARFEEYVRTDLLAHLRRTLGAPEDVPTAWGATIYMPFIWYASTDNMAITNEGMKVQDQHEWHPYAFMNIFFYVGLAVWLVLSLKLVGSLASRTAHFSFFIGCTMDLFVHLITILVLSGSWFWVVLLLFA